MTTEVLLTKIRITKRGCWLWTGYVAKNGYGQVGIGHRKKIYAHRLVYTRLVGPIPRKKKLCHKCDTPACVRPSHMFVGTQLDNMRDCSRKWRTRKNKLTPRQLRIIRSHPHRYGRWAQLAKRFNVSISAVSRAGLRDTFKEAA
jgi:hypothetical protein